MKAFRAVAFMFALTLIFTGFVTLVKVVNNDRIAQNQVVKMQRVVLLVLGLVPEGKVSNQKILDLFRERVESRSVKDRKMYVGYETAQRKKIKGYVFPVEGAGFWGQIYGMAAVTPKADRIMGLAFYKHSETPGLGARMTEKWFTDQFKSIKLSPDGQGKFFYLKPPGPDHAPNELDGITGASRTTEAVENFLNSEIKLFLDNYYQALKNEQG